MCSFGRACGDHVLGLVVDDFHGTEDIIQNPSPVFWLICAAFRAPLCWGWLGTDGFKY